MADFYEIDFLDVETDKSGDAIAIRYEIHGRMLVHLVDGGYQKTGPSIITHINKYYETNRIDHLVVTHCDRDHTGGLAEVLEKMEVGALWMLRPWLYAAELLPRFATYNDVDRLRSKLKSAFDKLHELEAIAIRRGIPIYDPFQGASIGEFTVLAPTRARYLDLIVESDKTPESVEESAETFFDRAQATVAEVIRKAARLVAGAWNVEVFSPDDTSRENEMSVVQCARICNKKIVLTADAGREALDEAADYATIIGFGLPGIDAIQIPHHGSRRNVSTALLDRWLGARLPAKPAQGEETFTAVVSSAKADEDHPRPSVVRAFIHRGAKVIQTESQSIRHKGGAAPAREGWSAVEGAAYPTHYEDD